VNIILDGITYTLIKTEECDSDYLEYDVFNPSGLIGKITKCGAEIFYSAWNVDGENRGTGKTLRDTLENMLLNIFYSASFKGDRYIKTLGAWVEGGKVSVEYVKNDIVKQAERVVKYSSQAGDLYITLDNRKYFYCEFD